MFKFLNVSLVLLLFIISGCGQSEKAVTAEGGKETVKEKEGDAALTAAKKEEVVQVLADKSEDSEQKADPAGKDVVSEGQEVTAEKTEKVQEMAGQAVEATTEVMSDAKETVSEKAETDALAKITAAGESVEIAQQAVSPETIVLEASYGNVTFPHALHGDAYACSVCHGEGSPGLFGLDKEKAHALCKDCHKQEAAGPTACKDCHKK